MKKQKSEPKMRVSISDLPSETRFKLETSQEAINTIKWPVKAEVVIETTVYELMNTSFIEEVNSHQKKNHPSWQDSENDSEKDDSHVKPGKHPAGDAPEQKDVTPSLEAESDSKDTKHA